MVAYSFKRRFVMPIQVGLGLQQHIPGTEYVPKRQTIRAVGKRRHASVGEVVQLYHGMRTRQCFKIGEGRCTEVLPIEIIVGDSTMPVVVDSKLIRDIDGFARSDGFEDGADMFRFWKAEHGPGSFMGLLVKWEPIR